VDEEALAGDSAEADDVEQVAMTRLIDTFPVLSMASQVFDRRRQCHDAGPAGQLQKVPQ
jgi:hypothetical protein